MQQTPGKFEALHIQPLADRLRAHLPTAGSIMVAGSCRYGVVARAQQTPFLLRYFPKALAGQQAELNALKPYGKVPLEIVAEFQGEKIRLTALKDGKPYPRAEFISVDRRLANTILKADEKGEVVWQPAPGTFSIYMRTTRNEPGELDGQKYAEIRDFATLAMTWPLQSKDADPAAVALFEDALAARAEWRDFPGFEAKIAGNVSGRLFAGSVVLDATGKASFTDNDPSHREAVADWIEEQLASIALHRLARPQPPDQKKPVLRFAQEGEAHPFGPLLIFEGGRFASSYRVKDRQILVVNRNLGKQNMTITVLDNDLTKEGKALPRTYQVQYWDALTGKLLRTETFQNRWQRVRARALPAVNQVTVTSDAGMVVRSFTLAHHMLLNTKK